VTTTGSVVIAFSGLSVNSPASSAGTPSPALSASSWTRFVIQGYSNSVTGSVGVQSIFPYVNGSGNWAISMSVISFSNTSTSASYTVTYYGIA
jgi:hypothetical protein